MNPKAQPNRKRYIEILRRMTPAQRLQKSFELTELSRQLLKDGLRNRHPNLTPQELHKRYLERLARCHNKNY